MLESAANQAMTLELLDWDETQRSIGIAGRKRGIRRLRAILSELDPDRPLLTASYLEDQFLRIVRDFGLPRPESNVYIEGIKVDFVWRAKRLVVETDGDRFHSTVITRRNDRQRDRILQLAGYRVLRFDYNDVTKMPAGVATQVRSAFEIRRGLPNRT
ncbi:MAG TPA: DUF559 domain-containing protein [Baekduia sp.]|nr:DUF559 domain-containing protein [Baekduia sp.]